MSIEELESKLKSEPGAPEFVELAKLLSEQRRNPEAREVCLRGLNANPRNTQGRLMLAKLYYQDKMGEFCVRELVELKKYTNVPSLSKLIESFGEYATAFTSSRENPTGRIERSEPEDESVMAEISIDADFDELAEEIEKAS